LTLSLGRRLETRDPIGDTPPCPAGTGTDHRLRPRRAAAAVGLTRFAAGLLFQVSATDPLVLVAASAFLAAIVLLAAWVPTRRAMRLDPVAALRDE
jgi:hypothetical protein